ncbi:hypothetical protein [Endozoicomonas sp. SCSIO W0465]|uniref:hypothetical protein n=1 Tax=Endozoicomonas sp. SCSIO W0465 TaxID=2918516 RepID=UPI0020765EA0|nr:hypothetical protein [Endozoicomonas sp. SCSIO W0465]USE38630.1 hypothetical protein MJO57_10945 [Endozoicomonas sp. SCSIO W0465]
MNSHIETGRGLGGVPGYGFAAGMPPSNSTTSTDSTARFSGRYAHPAEGERYSISSDSLESRSSIRDRIAFPFRTIKNQLIKSTIGLGFGAAIAGGAITGLVGGIPGGIAGGIVKLAKMIGGQDSDAFKNGSVLGAIVTAVLGLPVTLALAVAGAVVGLVIGTAGSLVKLPVDIYRATALDPRDLNKFEQELKKFEADLDSVWAELSKLWKG